MPCRVSAERTLDWWNGPVFIERRCTVCCEVEDKASVRENAVAR